MKSFVDLLLAVAAAMVVGVAYSYGLNAIYDKYMIGFSPISVAVVGSIFAFIVATPVVAGSISDRYTAVGSAVAAGFAAWILYYFLNMAFLSVVGAFMLFAIAFWLPVAVTRSAIGEDEISFWQYLTCGAILGVLLYFAGWQLGTNAGFTWMGLFHIGLHGVVSAFGAFVVMFWRNFRVNIPS